MEGYTGLKTGKLLTFRSEEERDIANVPASWGEGFSAAMVDSLVGSPGPLALRGAEQMPYAVADAALQRTTSYRAHLNTSDVMLSPEEANKKYGIGDLKFETPVADPVAKQLFEAQRTMLRRQDVIRRSQLGGFDIFVASLGGAALDPLSVAAGVFPAVGLSRVGLGAEQAVGLASRVGRGALEGAASSVALTPATYLLSQSQQRPYTVADAFVDVVFGTALGAGVHAGIGAFQKWRSSGDPMPGLQQVVQDLPRQDQEMLLRGAVASIMEGRPVNLNPLLVDALETMRAARGALTRVASEEDALLRGARGADDLANVNKRIAELELERTKLDEDIAAAAARGEPDAVTEARMRAIDDEMWAPGTSRQRKDELGAEAEMLTAGANPEANLDMLRAQAEAQGLTVEKGRVEGKIGALQEQAGRLEQVQRRFAAETGKLASKRSVAQALAERTLARLLGRESAAMRPEIAQAAKNILGAPREQAAEIIARELAALLSAKDSLAPGSIAGIADIQPATGGNTRKAILNKLAAEAAEPYYDPADVAAAAEATATVEAQPKVAKTTGEDGVPAEVKEIEALTAPLDEELKALDGLGYLTAEDKAYLAEADQMTALAQEKAKLRDLAQACMAN